LEYDYYPATADSPDAVQVLVLMHGRGANRHDLAGLRGPLPSDWHLVLPDAPHPGAPWGYGPGRAWYRFLGEDRPELESLQASMSELDSLLDALPARVGGSIEHLVVGGFSQGGTTGHSYALTRPDRVSGVLNFSGFLASNVPVSPESVSGKRFFWGHGMDDPAIPFALAVRGRAALRAAGADVEARDYGIGHWIDEGELRDATSWLGQFIN
jgi:phospholipase/carboxylesterase